MIPSTTLKKLRIIFAIVIVLAPPVQADEPVSRVFESRYMAVQIGPEPNQIDLLQSIINIQVPKQIKTVGQSLNYLMRPYGFEMAGNVKSEEQYLLFMLALPEPHRRLGPMTLIDALTIMGGESFWPVINPVKRTVQYLLRDGFDRFVTDVDKENAKKQWLGIIKNGSLSPDKSLLKQPVEKDSMTYGPVKSGEYLSRIALHFYVPEFTQDQVIVHIFQANLHAFANGNMNHLLVGEVLNIPPIEPNLVLSEAEASQWVGQKVQL